MLRGVMARVGGEVDSFCTKCELVLAHTVVAMVGATPVKVECNTCRGVHRYRGGTPSGAAPRAPRSATRTAAPRVSFEEMLAAHPGPPRRYSPATTFAAGDVVEHPSFGLGFVSAARDAGKVEVTFRSGPKTLVHGRGAAAPGPR